MQEIAQATFNYHDFNEIMPTIFRRFVEKEAHDWRQIYKALQLLEYIVKNGSERVVDEARAHLSTIKILRNFHYIDEQGKDQGVNIRARAKELAALLSDFDTIRAERRKARANRAKYQGVGSSDFVPGSGSGRYGGFSSDAYYASGGASGVYGTGAAGSSSAEPDFEEYHAGDDEDTAPAPQTSGPPVADLFSFDDEPPAVSKPAASKPATADDDFDDFQTAAPPKPPTPVKSATAPAPRGGDLFDLLDDVPSKPVAKPAQQPAATPARKSTHHPPPVKPSAAPAAPASSASLFDDLWTESRGKSTTTTHQGPKSMAQLAQDQSSTSVWGESRTRSTPPTTSKDLFDLL